MVQFQTYILIFSFICFSHFCGETESVESMVKSRQRRDASLSSVGSVLGPLLGLVTEGEMKAILLQINNLVNEQRNFSGIVDKQSTKSALDFQRINAKLDGQNNQMNEIRAKMAEISSSLKNILLFQEAFNQIQNLYVSLNNLEEKLDNYAQTVAKIVEALKLNKDDDSTERTTKSA